MSTCPCCGNSVTSEARQTVRVDDALISLCNDAYIVAQQWSAREVGIAHVTWCLARASAFADLFQHLGADRQRLIQAAERAMVHAISRERTSHELRTATDLKALLSQAERIAVQNGRDRASPREFLMALMRQPDGLAAAAFATVPDAPRATNGASGSRFDGERAEFHADIRAHAHAAYNGTAAAARHERSANGDEPALSRLQERRIDRRDGVHGRTSQHAEGAPSDRYSPLSSRERSSAPIATAASRDAEPHDAMRALSERLARLERHVPDAGGAAGRLVALERRFEEMQSLSQRLLQLERQGADARGLAERLAENNRRMDDMRAFAQRLQHLERQGAETREATARLMASEGRPDEAGSLSERLLQLERQNVDAQILASQLAASERQMGEMRALLTRLSETTADLSTQFAAELERTASLGLDGAGTGEGRGRGTSRGGGSRRRSSRSARAAAARARRMRRRMRIRLRRRHARRASMRTSRGWDNRKSAQRTERSQLPVPLVEARPEPASVAAPVVQIAEFDELPPADFDDDTDDTITREKRFYLTLDDDVEKAPSIGPRTAEQLAAARVTKVRHLLACDPKKVAGRVSSRYINAERIVAWKAQARLVCTVPWLRGTHAQLLVGAGFDTLEKLARADTASVCAGILRFAATRYGQAVLRSGAPPTADRIAKWVEHVTLAEPERAA
ncbi:MAG: DUF4332 domain-containing protein [Hyphomicrobiaceae bacterium]